MTSSRHVTVYTREGCHLCADACDVVATVTAEVGSGWSTVDIDSSDDLRERYSEQVPVICVDGEQIAYWRIDERRLRAALL